MVYKLIRSQILRFCEIQFHNRKDIFLKLHFYNPWKTKSLTGNQRGQSIIEYVLLLVVVVGLFYGLSKALFEPLRKYGSDVFTNTIACAFEYGQLPAEIVTEDGCEAAFRGGRLADSSSSQSQRDSKSTTKNKMDEANKKSKPTSTTSSSETAGSGGSGRSTTIYSKGNTLQLGRASGVEGKSNKTVTIAGDDSRTKFDVSDNDFSIKRGRRPILKPISGELETIILNAKKKKTGEINRSIASSTDTGEKRSKKLILSNKKKSQISDETQKPWDFYAILRIALIFLMIMAILIFVFFQLSQIRKGST